jgi:hypothetical protein
MAAPFSVDMTLIEYALFMLYAWFSRRNSEDIMLSAVPILVLCVLVVDFPPVALTEPADLVEGKNLAKAKLVREQTGLQQLLKARYDTARKCFEVQEAEFLAGRATMSILYEFSRNLLSAERGLRAANADRLTALERYLERTERIHKVNTERYEKGRLGFRDFAESSYLRRDAEIHLIEARRNAASGNGTPGAVNILTRKQVAKTRFEADQTRLRELSEIRLQVARNRQYPEEAEFRAGRGSLFRVIDSSNQVLESELTLADKNDKRLASLERHRERVWFVDDVTKARYGAGRVPLSVYLSTQYARMIADRRLAAFRGEHPDAQPLTPAGPLWVRWFNPADELPTVFAQAKWSAFSLENGKAPVRKMRELARSEYRERLPEFMNGRGYYGFVLDSSERMMDCETELSENESERRAAIERHWQRVVQVEERNRKLFNAGRLPRKDYLHAVYCRLDVEIRLAEAAGKK